MKWIKNHPLWSWFIFCLFFALLTRDIRDWMFLFIAGAVIRGLVIIVLNLIHKRNRIRKGGGNQ